MLLRQKPFITPQLFMILTSCGENVVSHAIHWPLWAQCAQSARPGAGPDWRLAVDGGATSSWRPGGRRPPGDVSDSGEGREGWWREAAGFGQWLGLPQGCGLEWLLVRGAVGSEDGMRAGRAGGGEERGCGRGAGRGVGGEGRGWARSGDAGGGESGWLEAGGAGMSAASLRDPGLGSRRGRGDIPRPPRPGQ